MEEKDKNHKDDIQKMLKLITDLRLDVSDIKDQLQKRKPKAKPKPIKQIQPIISDDSNAPTPILGYWDIRGLA